MKTLERLPVNTERTHQLVGKFELSSAAIPQPVERRLAQGGPHLLAECADRDRGAPPNETTKALCKMRSNANPARVAIKEAGMASKNLVSSVA